MGGAAKSLFGVYMNKQSKESQSEPQQQRGSKKTFPLDEANAMKHQKKEEVDGIPGRPKDESHKTHRRTP